MLLSLAAVVSSPASEKPITVPLAGHQICKDATQTSGPCTVKVHGCSGIYKFKLKYAICAMFNTSDDVAAGALSYKAFAWDLNQTNCSGSVVKYDQPAAAGEAAAKAVLAKCPQLALTCANVTGEALALPPRSAWQLA